MTEDRAALAGQLMAGFADRTGLTSSRPPRRYLWTDAFAVCNFISLGDIALALRLVDQVHHTLGRHREDDPRQGWIGPIRGQDEAHPTRGGLRIGKELPERRPDEPLDDQLEWEREGQYFHYHTRWMHALDQLTRATGDPVFNLWARELADVAHRAFTRDGRMAWKMSVDLTRPLVPSMGHHDPLDGYVTCLALEATASELGTSSEGPFLTDAIADFAAMIPSDLSTTDPLGLGGLLTDAWWLAALRGEAGATRHDDLLGRLVVAARWGLEASDWARLLQLPAGSRLAFRELGLAIGLAAVPLLGEVDARLADRLGAFVPLRSAIESFWTLPAHRAEASWRDHQDINDVMLATSLMPSGYLLRDLVAA